MNKLAEKLRSMHKAPEGVKPEGITININIPAMPAQGVNPMLAMMMRKIISSKEDKKEGNDFVKVEGLSPSVS